MRRAFKIFIRILVILIILVGVAIACIPKYFSSKRGTAILKKQIERNYGGTCSIKKISLQWFGLQNIQNIEYKKDGTVFKADNVSLKMPLYKIYAERKQPLELLFTGHLLLTNGEIVLNKEASLTDIQIDTNESDRSINASGNSQIGAKKSGRFIAKAIEGDSWALSGNINNFPTKIVEFLYPKIEAKNILGESFKADFTLDKQLLNLSFVSPKLRFTTEGKIDDTFYHFKKKTTLQYILDQSATHAIFKDSSIKPLSAQIIQLDIDPQNASFQYHPFKKDSININSMNLNLGKMIFQNFGTLSNLLSLIKLQVRPNNNVLIWFQDMPIRVEKGIAHITRTEMLVDRSSEVAFWGDVDFPKQNVNGYIGITAQVLKNSFKLKKIGNSYVMPVRVDGNFDNIKLHGSDVLGEIAKIYLAQKAGLPFVPTNPKKMVPKRRSPTPW